MALRKQTAAAPPAPVGVNFGESAMYTGGAFVPEGDYILELNTQMHQGKDANGVPKGPERLGVMVAFYPFLTPSDEHKITQFYSMGSKAHLSFAPDPNTGKGLVLVPGGPGTTLNDKTNWNLFRQSLLDSGLPAGIFTNDLSVLDGIWVHVTNVDEPAERAGYASNTAEVAATPRQPGKIAIVTEIKEGGCPWEGGGGIPNGTPAPAAPKAAAPKAAAPARAAAPAPAATPAPAPSGADEQDVRTAAINGISDVLEKKPNGCTRLLLKTETFKAVRAKSSEEMAGQVAESFFEGHDDELAALLGEVGYKIEGAQVKPAA